MVEIAINLADELPVVKYRPLGSESLMDHCPAAIGSSSDGVEHMREVDAGACLGAIERPGVTTSRPIDEFVPSPAEGLKASRLDSVGLEQITHGQPGPISIWRLLKSGSSIFPRWKQRQPPGRELILIG